VADSVSVSAPRRGDGARLEVDHGDSVAFPKIDVKPFARGIDDHRFQSGRRDADW
jgi:hypothetical protein